MKSHSWDDLNDSAKDFFDSAGLINDNNFDEHGHDRHAQRRRLTELRRRAEERLDWKRLYGDFQFDDLDQDEAAGFSSEADDYDDLAEEH